MYYGVPWVATLYESRPRIERDRLAPPQDLLKVLVFEPCEEGKPRQRSNPIRPFIHGVTPVSTRCSGTLSTNPRANASG